MQTVEIAEFVARLMTTNEMSAFIAANETERKQQARAVVDRYCDILQSVIDDPQFPVAARQVCLSRVLHLSVNVSDLRAA